MTDLKTVPGPELWAEVERRVKARSDMALVYALTGPNEDDRGQSNTRLSYTGHPLFCRGLLIELSNYLESKIQQGRVHGGW